MTSFADKGAIPSVSVSYTGNGRSTKANEFGMRPMQERAFEKRGEQYLLIKSPPASGKSRALMFIALDKLANQGVKQAIIVVPEKSIGASFHDESLSRFGFWADWHVEPEWNLCDAPATTMAARSMRLAPSLKATTRRWSAPTRPSASPSRSESSSRRRTARGCATPGNLFQWYRERSAAAVAPARPLQG